MGSRFVRRRFALGVAVGVAAAGLWAPTAGAGLLFTGPAQTCETQTSQPFRPWNDSANYVLLPGGSFEGGAPGWTLKGGAAVAPGNETFYVRAPGDRYSLKLPAGSSAMTPTMCFALGDWHLRFFIRKTGTGSGSVKVTVTVKTLLGVLTILDGGNVSATGLWSPSPRVALLLSNVTSLVGTQAVAFRFQASGTSFQVDDVYLDPWKSY